MIRAAFNKLRIYKELPMRQLSDSAATQKFENQQIAPVVYQTWEDRYFGKTHLQQITYFKALNPDLDFKLFDGVQREAYMREHWGGHPIFSIYMHSQFGPMKADIFRYCLLYECGGFYFDISKGCNVALSTFLKKDSTALITVESHDCFIPPNPILSERMQHPDKQVLQWGMGFAKGHPILLRMIDNICLHYPFFKNTIFANPKNAIVRFTGPGMFTKSVREYFEERADESVAQAGIDFNGMGVFALKGSWARYSRVPFYGESRHQPIVL